MNDDPCDHTMHGEYRGCTSARMFWSAVVVGVCLAGVVGVAVTAWIMS